MIRFQADAITQAGAAVRHAFFSRQGGVSDGIYGSLNCGFGSGDAEDRVAANRSRAVTSLDLAADSLVTLHQAHTTTALVVDAAFERGRAPVADGLVTRTPGLALGVLSADCAPVLMADAEAGVIGAAHAGWRGAVGGVVESTIDAMTRLGARTDRIVAAVGPCIGWESYEVGPEFRAQFVAAAPANASFFVPAVRAGHFRFNLPGYVKHRLDALGVASAEALGLDTCADADRFFSYRRNTLGGEKRYGRNLSTIALAP